jgi:hypothetical protein
MMNAEELRKFLLRELHGFSKVCDGGWFDLKHAAI